MKAIEFETKTQNGLIVLPEKYTDFNDKRTRIIVLVEEDDGSSLIIQKKERLRLAFMELQKVNPFISVNEPVE